MCWEPSVVESPLQPWMIGLLCSVLSRSRSVCFYHTLSQDAVPLCSRTESLWLVFGSSKKCLPGITLQACKQYRGHYDSMQPP